jgi:hypothetical protein
MADDEDPNAADDWGNAEEVGSDDDDNDDSECDVDMDDFVEDNDEGESGNDEDDEDDDDDDEETMKNMEIFIRTFHNGDYDKVFANSLDLDRNKILPTQPSQASYDNKPDDWVERNRTGLESVKAQLQTCIDSVKHGEIFNLWLAHPSDNEEPIVWHEPILDRYWDQLEKADWRMQPKMTANGTDYGTIEIWNVEMTVEHLAALIAIFNNGRATDSIGIVRFINANICGEGIAYLSKLVDVSSKLGEFRLNHNRIDNMDSARCLSWSIMSHSCIIQLNLEHCDLGSSPEILSVILQSEAPCTNISNNNIDSSGAVTIAEYLEGDPPIRSLFLDHNRLNDDDAVLISQALKRNTKLKLLSLHSNNFTSIGVKALLNCVFDSSSLNALSESNHTLEIMFLFEWQEKDMTSSHSLDCIWFERFQWFDQTHKIMLALQDKDAVLKYFANVPVELMPEVLAFPLQQVGDQFPLRQVDKQCRYLNLVYSTMRWWNMPMLYSYHDCFVKSDAKRKRNN